MGQKWGSSIDFDSHYRAACDIINVYLIIDTSAQNAAGTLYKK